MEDSLRSSEEKLQQEVRLVELSRTPIFVWQFDGGITQWNRGSEELYGYTRQEALGKTYSERLGTVVPGSSFAVIRDALVKTGSWKGELQHTTKDGRQLTVEASLELIGAGQHRLVLESTRDITQAKASQARMALLLRELTHRVKNTLTVMQSIIRQTWRSSQSGEDFVSRIEGRIAALANSHGLLVETDWQGADLNALIQSQVGSYVVANPSRLQLQGEPIRLPADVATPFGLVLHELATNAAKYGALSVDKGRVDLSWSEEKSGNGAHVLRVVWRERGGPPVKKPATNGFGSRLIETGLPTAVVRHEFRGEGVTCTIDLPWGGEERHGPQR
jgi:two-component system, chemotaxis family, CheB/CheR fusion protein